MGNHSNPKSEGNVSRRLANLTGDAAIEFWATLCFIGAAVATTYVLERLPPMMIAGVMPLKCAVYAAELGSAGRFIWRSFQGTLGQE